MTTPIVVALDYPEAAPALSLVAQLSPQLCRLKVGKELFSSAGPALVEHLQELGFDVFLDLKFHDIPNTVAGAIRAACALGVWMVNIHAGGGQAMMAAARDALASSANPPLLIAVTVLTSMTAEDLRQVGCENSVLDQVLRLAGLAQQSGMDGVVCSAMEAQLLRATLGPDFCLVTPGIRSAGDDGGDQRRVMTPAAALDMGSDYLVIGRSITAAQDPLAALQRIHDEIDSRA